MESPRTETRTGRGRTGLLLIILVAVGPAVIGTILTAAGILIVPYTTKPIAKAVNAPRPEDLGLVAIPGVSENGIVAHFTAKGVLFDSRGWKTSKRLGLPHGEWESAITVNGTSYSVTAYGSDPTKLWTVTTVASSTDPTRSIEEIRQFLTYAASLPYEGAEPDEAQQWVVANWSQHRASRTFGSVTFELMKSNGSWTLRLSGK